ncbi:putative olfactory receptor 52P1 [Zalophus californianus]|uniref:Olfactory receptor 52P1 n=1 Tax=Zalophus californianus TaxID=9704 RepID=A0A6J2BRP2_ZALCA|nr:putative olfactory receptor 52P1 [Zalophus californianus]XP_027972591.1 putative olfactory receptor 52P1 [Eumetopias jubatus]
MLILIHSSFLTFTLMDIPGLESQHLWLSLPFSSMFFATLIGNGAILFLVATEPSLHSPMYLFLALLLGADLISTLALLPKLLCLFWFKDRDRAANACFIQMFFIPMFFIHGASVVRSALLVAMASDSFMAVWEPLRYNTILSHSLVGCLGLVALAKGVILILPMPLLLQRLKFCHVVFPHTYCDHMAVVKMACGHTRPNHIYGLFVIPLMVGLDLLLIRLSYGLMLQPVVRLNSRDATCKALNTCSAHLFVILVTYVPALFSSLTHRIGHNIPPHAHVLLANFYLLLPSVLNPIIYGIKMKEIRHKVAKCFCRRPAEAVSIDNIPMSK